MLPMLMPRAAAPEGRSEPVRGPHTRRKNPGKRPGQGGS